MEEFRTNAKFWFLANCRTACPPVNDARASFGAQAVYLRVCLCDSARESRIPCLDFYPCCDKNCRKSSRRTRSAGLGMGVGGSLSIRKQEKCLQVVLVKTFFPYCVGANMKVKGRLKTICRLKEKTEEQDRGEPWRRVSYRPVHLVLQILVDPLQSCIAALDPGDKNTEINPCPL